MPTLGKIKNDNSVKEQITILFNNFNESIKQPDFSDFRKYITENSVNYYKERFPIGYGGYYYPLKKLTQITKDLDINFSIDKIEHNESHYSVSGEWISNNENIRQNLKSEKTRLSIDYLIVREDSALKIIHPIELYSKLWNSYESKYFNFYFHDTQIKSYLKQINEMDNHFKYLSDLFHFKTKRKIMFFKCNNVDETKLLNQFKPQNGWCNNINNVIISTSFEQLHEPVHIIAENSGYKFSNIIFDEGLAVALGGTTNIPIESINKKAKNIINSPKYISIKQVLSFDYSEFMNKADITYFEMGSFVNFLIEEYGIEKYLSLSSENLNNINLIETIFERKYNCRFEKLEKKWLNYLKNST
jgi:hypothetical protein